MQSMFRKGFEVLVNKPCCYFLLGLVLSVFTIPPNAGARGCGTNCGGGGETLLSSEAEVQAAFELATERETYGFLEALADRQALTADYVDDPVLKSALRRLEASVMLLGRYSKLFDDLIWNSKLELRDECPRSHWAEHSCAVNHGSSLAFTEFEKPGAPVCVSRNELRKIGPNDLLIQLMSVRVHEILHHYQPQPRNCDEYEEYEREARALQQHVHSLLLGYANNVVFHRVVSFDGDFTYSLLSPGGVTRAAGSKLGCASSIEQAQAMMTREAIIVLSPGNGIFSDKRRILCVGLPAVPCRITHVRVNRPSRSGSRDWYLGYVGRNAPIIVDRLSGAQTNLQNRQATGVCQDGAIPVTEETNPEVIESIRRAN